MEKNLVICLAANSGISPFLINIEDESMYVTIIKEIFELFYKDDGVVYAEVYRVCDVQLLKFKDSYAFDGVSVTKCRFFAPSWESLKYFIEKNSFPSLKL